MKRDKKNFQVDYFQEVMTMYRSFRESSPVVFEYCARYADACLEKFNLRKFNN